VLLHYLRKCSSSEIASFHSKCSICFASFKQSTLDFFKLVESRLILMLLYDSLILIISGVHQSRMGSYRSEKVKLRSLDCVAYKMCQSAVLLKDKIIICVW